MSSPVVQQLVRDLLGPILAGAFYNSALFGAETVALVLYFRRFPSDACVQAGMPYIWTTDQI